MSVQEQLEEALDDVQRWKGKEEVQRRRARDLDIELAGVRRQRQEARDDLQAFEDGRPKWAMEYRKAVENQIIVYLRARRGERYDVIIKAIENGDYVL